MMPISSAQYAQISSFVLKNHDEFWGVRFERMGDLYLLTKL
jgi:hypothetical protein